MNEINETFPSFDEHPVPVHHSDQRIGMDTGEDDPDGDTDIMLENLSKRFMNQDNFKPDWGTRLPFIRLKNSTVKKN